MNKDKLFSYHKWAALACLDHIQTFEEEIYRREGLNSFTSIQKTIEHILGVERLWFLRMHGIEQPAFERLDVSTIEKAKESVMLLHAEMELYFASLPDEHWQELLKFKNTRGDDFENTREEMLFSLINHATYHRGQITSLLRQFGKEGTLLDYYYYAHKNR
ncbi:DinB family protein [Planomicrobium sp. CPCC 101079]|uniref:DinB family protein n=1 Tax=Planomicrobium sp. CPCC 101079 TaxID=2599618 RepID=UPI0011B50013|nr:DinB family protein [Planomicrobium sp. CPCC 101079]TWT13454.1 hypothetical protein FQV28_01980 [Planomicrobium sp. CPCC 101079]